MDFSVDEQRAILSKSLALVRKSVYRLQQIDDSNFPTDSSDTARELLRHCIEKLGEPVRVAPMSPAVLFNRLHEILKLIDVVELSSTDRISWPLVNYCDAMWSDLFGEDGPKIFYSVTPDHNYKITRFTRLLGFYLRDLLPSVVISNLTADKELYCLELASAEDDNLPLYANIGHEFGHAVFDLKREELVNALRLQLTPVANEIYATLESTDSATAPRRFRRLGQAIVGIAKELFCDLVGSVLMGPAFYLSLYEIAWGQDSKTTLSVGLSPNDNEIKAYPSMHFRLACIKHASAIDGFCKDAAKSFKSHKVDHLSGLLELLSTVPTDHAADDVRVRPDTDPDKNEIEKVLTNYLDRIKHCMDEFLKNCRTHLRDWYPSFSHPRVDASDIAALLHRLDNRLLPNVIPDDTLLGKRASFAAILNASALFRLRMLVQGKIDDQIELERQINLVERLTSKSFEVSFIHNQFLNWKEGK